MTELEKKKDVLLNEYRKLIRLSNSKEFFNIPSVNQLESEITALKQQGEPESADIKKIATDFFRHWWNTPGNNTDQGFDDWWKDNEQKYAQQGEVTDEMIEELSRSAFFREIDGLVHSTTLFKEWAKHHLIPNER